MLVILDKLNFYLYKFWGFLKPRRKLGLVSFVILASFFIVVLVSGTNVAHADVLSWEGIVNGIAGLILTVAGWFIKLTFFILKFVIEVAGYNGFIDSQAVIVGWVMVRDVTNMFFVVVLLIISFGTILGLEQYEYKKLLVKLLMAAVIVNFSRIICGVIIDVAQVVMITFVNGVAATAAGNLVNMFHVDKILKLSGEGGASLGTPGQIFLAAVAAITFAAIMMVTMLTFLFLLMARMLTLWILIVLSPFAFVLNVLPQTQTYAGQWWKEFGGNVVAGPIIAFFLWLSFVTVGAGDAHQHIADRSEIADTQKLNASSGDTTAGETSTGITDIMTWANMANFAIAIGMLLTGAKVAQQLGAAGGSMMGKAGEFGKKVAMVASGATAARWAGRGALAGAKKAGKWGAMNVPLVGGKSWQRRGQEIKSGIGTWYGKRLERKALEANKRMGVLTDKGATRGAKAKAWLGMRFLTPEALKQDLANDKEEINKMQREIAVVHSLSGSKMPTGLLKTETKAKLSRMKGSGDDISARKEAESQEKYQLGTVNKIQAALEPKIEQEEQRLGRALKDDEINDVVDKTSEELGVSQIDAGYYKRMLNARRSRASAENITEIASLKKEEAAFRSRAANYRNRGDNNKADLWETKANALESDKLKEGLKGRRGMELLSIIQDTAGGVAAATKEVSAAKASGNTEQEKKASESLKKKQHELFVAMNLARGHEEAWVARAADASVITGAGIDTAGLSDQEIALSIDLGANIKDLNLNVKGAAQEVTNFLGGTKKAQAALRERSIVDERNVTMGITERSDTIKSRMAKGGRTEYSVNEDVLLEPAANRAQVQGYKKVMNLNTMINAPISIKNRNVSDMSIKNVSKEEMEIVADKLKNITTKVGIDKINDSFINDLNQAKVSDTGGKKAIKDFYEKLEKEMDDAAYKGFLARTAGFYEQAGGVGSTPSGGGGGQGPSGGSGGGGSSGGGNPSRGGRTHRGGSGSAPSGADVSSRIEKEISEITDRQKRKVAGLIKLHEEAKNATGEELESLQSAIEGENTQLNNLAGKVKQLRESYKK